MWNIFANLFAYINKKQYLCTRSDKFDNHILNVCAVKRGRFSLFDNYPFFAKYVLNGKNSTFFSKNSGKNLRISKNVCTFALRKLTKTIQQ